MSPEADALLRTFPRHAVVYVPTGSDADLWRPGVLDQSAALQELVDAGLVRRMRSYGYAIDYYELTAAGRQEVS